MNGIQAVIHVLRGRPRSFATDAVLALRHTPSPPRLRGADNIPESGPLVVVANHYERPGLWMAWPAAHLAHVVQERTGRDIHWIAIQEWESLSLCGVRIPPSLTRIVFERAFTTYGILAMPPPHAPAASRASSMRQAAVLIKRGKVVGLMPEGDVGSTPQLLRAREGVGAFLLLLAGAGARILPVGFYEEEGHLVTEIGGAFELVLPAGMPKDERDNWARTRIMHAIQDLLPAPLHGAYAASPLHEVGDMHGSATP